MKMEMGGHGFQIQGMMMVVLVVMVISGTAQAQTHVHHVVGGDRGWDPTSDLVSWSSGRVFRVGDQIWFTYSVAQGLIAELKSREEYESCDVSNPIKMYTEGLHTIPLEREGIRYFVSSEPEHCKTGLKLHVEVLPKTAPARNTNYHTPTVEAAGPTTPSGSARYAHKTFLVLVVIFCVTVGLAY
ncbi:mavicyanin-like [Gastrolobium bilobum]|uniref:mavicyanin-like n=1 Tax=Gastrolobium bilobum TaxID=150636 RepID=UPI002AB17C34|nr:mavicyanin-like [Gastrolobium bilobum]